MLVTTIEQVREVIGSAIRKENTFEILKPYLEGSEENLLLNLIGQQQLTALYGSVTGTAAALKSLVVKAIVWNGYQEAWYQGFYQFGGTGVTKQNVKDTESLFRYQEDNIQNDIVKKADEATERLMLFLEKNADSFPLYKESDEFANNFNNLVFSPTTLHRALPEVTKSYRMFNVLKGYMTRVENKTVRSIMGTNLFYDLKGRVAAGDVLPAVYKNLLSLCQEYIAPAVLLEAMPWIAVQFTPDGIRIAKVFNNLKDENPLSDLQTQNLQDLLTKRVDDAKAALRTFLNETASQTVFPYYFNSELYRSPGSKTWNMPSNDNKKHFRL